MKAKPQFKQIFLKIYFFNCNLNNYITIRKLTEAAKKVIYSNVKAFIPKNLSPKKPILLQAIAKDNKIS